MTTTIRKAMSIVLTFALVFTGIAVLTQADTYAASRPKKVTLKNVGTTDGTAYFFFTFQKNATGYELYRKSGSGKWVKAKTISGKKIKTNTEIPVPKRTGDTANRLLKDGKTAKVRIKNLKAGKEYKFKMRAYVSVNGKKKYGSFSKIITKKAKTIEGARKSTLKAINSYVISGDLVVDPGLQKIAQKWANYMAKKDRDLDSMKDEPVNAYDEVREYDIKHGDGFSTIQISHKTEVTAFGKALNSRLGDFYSYVCNGGYDCIGVGYKSGYIIIIVIDDATQNINNPVYG